MRIPFRSEKGPRGRGITVPEDPSRLQSLKEKFPHPTGGTYPASFPDRSKALPSPDPRRPVSRPSGGFSSHHGSCSRSPTRLRVTNQLHFSKEKRRAVVIRLRQRTGCDQKGKGL